MRQVPEEGEMLADAVGRWLGAVCGSTQRSSRAHGDRFC